MTNSTITTKPTSARSARESAGFVSRVRVWLGTVPTLAIIGTILTVVLAIGGGLLFWGSSFASNMVHNQLTEQNITFPAKGSPGLKPAQFPGLQRYAGQAVDSGPKAKAYADQFIKVHLSEVAGGKTYSEVSAASNANPSDTKLSGQTQTLFRGETLRGLLLYAWGWSLIGRIAFWVSIGAWLLALVVLLALGMGFGLHERELKKAAS